MKSARRLNTHSFSLFLFCELMHISLSKGEVKTTFPSPLSSGGQPVDRIRLGHGLAFAYSGPSSPRSGLRSTALSLWVLVAVIVVVFGTRKQKIKDEETVESRIPLLFLALLCLASLPSFFVLLSIPRLPHSIRQQRHKQPALRS